MRRFQREPLRVASGVPVIPGKYCGYAHAEEGADWEDIDGKLRDALGYAGHLGLELS